MASASIGDCPGSGPTKSRMVVVPPAAAADDLGPGRRRDGILHRGDAPFTAKHVGAAAPKLRYDGTAADQRRCHESSVGCLYTRRVAQPNLADLGVLSPQCAT